MGWFELTPARWHLVETAALRATGFPFAALQELRFPSTVSAVKAMLACERETEELREHLLRVAFPEAVRRARTDADSRQVLAWLSRTRRAVGRRTRVSLDRAQPNSELSAPLAQWNDLLDRHADLRAQGSEAWASELDECRAALRARFRDARIQEAVFLSSPAMHRQLVRYLDSERAPTRSAQSKALERRLISYLQRFCAKNETQSFFGPINYARIDPSVPDSVRVRRARGSLRRRQTFASQWMVEKLAQAIAAEPELQPYLRPRRNPLYALEGDHLCSASGERLPVDGPSRTLWQLASGERTLGELAEDSSPAIAGCGPPASRARAAPCARQRDRAALRSCRRARLPAPLACPRTGRRGCRSALAIGSGRSR